MEREPSQPFEKIVNPKNPDDWEHPDGRYSHAAGVRRLRAAGATEIPPYAGSLFPTKGLTDGEINFLGRALDATAPPEQQQ